MDVIALGSVGIKNVVAGMGTALTDGQAREIARLVPLVYVCYDGDSAGRKATIKNVETLMKAGLEVRVVSLADGCDPDDTIRGEGYEGFIAHDMFEREGQLYILASKTTKNGKFKTSVFVTENLKKFAEVLNFPPYENAVCFKSSP